MDNVAKRFGLLALAANALLMNVSLHCAAQAQEVTAIVDVNYDDKPPRYDFGFRYGGYKMKGPGELVDLFQQLSKKAKRLIKGGNEGGALEVSLDTSKLKIPSKNYLNFAYVGLGAGISGDIVNSDFSNFEVANFKVVFDAKIENGKTMSNSRVELNFVTSDGKGPKPDSDMEDDLLCKLRYAGSQSVDDVELTNQFQTIEVELADMAIESGSFQQIQKFHTRGVTLIVIAEDAPSCFGVGGQTKLIVDNYRLLQKQKFLSKMK